MKKLKKYVFIESNCDVCTNDKVHNNIINCYYDKRNNVFNITNGHLSPETEKIIISYNTSFTEEELTKCLITICNNFKNLNLISNATITNKTNYVRFGGINKNNMQTMNKVISIADITLNNEPN